MTTFVVTFVRREPSKDGTRAHIKALCATDELTYSLRHVIESLPAGDRWISGHDGETAVIEVRNISRKLNRASPKSHLCWSRPTIHIAKHVLRTRPVEDVVLRCA